MTSKIIGYIVIICNSPHVSVCMVVYGSLFYFQFVISSPFILILNSTESEAVLRYYFILFC